MVFSLVILALPVGVIGSTFSKIWQDFDDERKQEKDERRHEMRHIIKAIQMLDPPRFSKLLFVQVWHDPLDNDQLGETALHFMGEATLELELPLDTQVSKQHILRLEDNPDLVKRFVSGHVTLKYEWKPSLSRTPLYASSQEGVHDGDRSVDTVLSFELMGVLE